MKQTRTPPLDLPRRNYIDRLLERYRTTPGAVGRVHRNDRDLAHQLFERSVPIEVIEAALDLAARRRLQRPTDATPLTPIRSLAYFLPVLDELLDTPPSPDYYQYLRRRLHSLPPS